MYNINDNVFRNLNMKISPRTYDPLFKCMPLTNLNLIIDTKKILTDTELEKEVDKFMKNPRN